MDRRGTRDTDPPAEGKVREPERRRWRARARETQGPPASAPRADHSKGLRLLRGLACDLSSWLKIGVLVLLLVAGLAWLEHTRSRSDREFRTLQTQLEMKAVAVLVRSNVAATGGMPEDLQQFLAQNLKKNKEYGAGKDFWGSDYTVEEFPDHFEVRSAGPDGKPRTPDDLTCEMALPAADE
ncbi:MAG: hypothetical protein HY319_02810 [Armatimonadetes bacterium]|nr:hypothetical protein [Armatimonadota bacterium]